MIVGLNKMGAGARDEALKQVARESGDVQFFTRREMIELPHLIGDGEGLLAFCSGAYKGNTWLIALTDRRVLFLDKGMFFGLKQISIPLEKVNAVSGKTGIILGKIFIEDGASTYQIDNVSKASVGIFTKKVRDAIEIRRLPPTPTVATPSAAGPIIDRITRLERLGTLRDKGVLTSEEFESEKSKILKSQ